jgi:hypothetical protein
MKTEARYEVFKKYSVTTGILIKIRKQKIKLIFLIYRRIRYESFIPILRKDIFNSDLIG